MHAFLYCLVVLGIIQIVIKPAIRMLPHATDRTQILILIVGGLFFIGLGVGASVAHNHGLHFPPICYIAIGGLTGAGIGCFLVGFFRAVASW